MCPVGFVVCKAKSPPFWNPVKGKNMACHKYRYATLHVISCQRISGRACKMIPMSKKAIVEFGKRLAALRRQRGLSQRGLAQRVGISARMMAYYEKKPSSLPIHLLESICKALTVSADALVGIKGIKEEIDSKEYFLWKRFKKAEKLSTRDKKALFHFLNALLAKNQTQDKNGTK